MRLHTLPMASVGLGLGLFGCPSPISGSPCAFAPTTAKGWRRDLRRCAAFLALCGACLLVLAPSAVAAEAPAPDSARYATLMSLAKDLSLGVKAAAQKPAAAGADANAQERAADVARFAQIEFDGIAASSEPPSKFRVASIGHALYRLAAWAPEIYRSVLADATIRSRLLEVERAFETPYFADRQGNAGAAMLLNQVQELAQDMAVEEPVVAKSEEGNEDVRLSRYRITTRQQLDAALERLGEALRDAQQMPVPRLLAPNVLVEAAKFLNGRLVSEARPKEFEFAKGLMRYLGDGRYWQAHGLFRHFAALDPNDAALAAGLGEILLQTLCKSAATADYACLTSLSILQLHYQTLRDRGLVVKTRARLDDAIRQNLKLRLALSPPAPQGKKGGGEREDAAFQLLNSIPRLNDFGRDGAEGALRKWHEVQAVSYWVVKATAKRPKDLERLLESQPSSLMFSNNVKPEMVAVAAFAQALAVADGGVALSAVAMLRNEVTENTRGERSDDPELVQANIQLDVMELLAWQADNNLPRSRQVAKRIQASIAPMLKRQRTAADGVMPTCPPTANKDAFDDDGERSEFIEGINSDITQLQMRWDLKEGKRVALPLIYTALSQDVRALLMPREVRSNRRFADAEDRRPQPLSPAQFITRWEELYGPALRAHAGQLRPAAAAVKCLLRLPGLEPQLAADFVNKDSAGKSALAKALYTLLDDSGFLPESQTPVADGDFRLLQLVSVLQAHLGFSAAVARAAFPSEMRETIRQAEVGIAKLERRTDSLRSMFAFVQIDGGPRDAMFSLMEIASAYPEAYAKYAELKQQSIAGLAEVTGALGSDEAAVLFSGAGERLLAVVVRKSGATVIPIKVPVSTLQATMSTLLDSIRQPSDGANSLPHRFRADAAWTVYQQVFQPLEARLAGASTVYLVGGELLGGLPFQALLTAQPPPQDKVDFFTYRRLSWLGDKFAFVSLPSMHSVKRLADKASQEAAAKLWGVGEATISGTTLRAMELSGIPETSQLLERAGKGGDLPPLLRADATYANFASGGGSLSKADIVLVNSHTLAAGRGERFGTKDAAIVLAPSGMDNVLGADLLTPIKVVELSIPVRLTLLLACETAGGAASRQAQPFAGLVNAFFFSGADTVLATAQAVNSAISEDLAVHFLRLVRDDRLSSAKALQRASAEARCPDDASPCAAGEKFVWGHPAYWAHFMLVGSGR